MYKTMKSCQARNNFSQMIDQVLNNQRIVITRFNKPAVVMTKFTDFNPQRATKKQEWKKGFSLVENLRSKTKKLSSSQINQLVEEVLAESGE